MKKVSFIQDFHKGISQATFFNYTIRLTKYDSSMLNHLVVI